MKSPLISIIIPAYNNAEYLDDAIQSVLNQTYPKFELIIINDASPDHVEEVVKAYSDNRIQYIRHEKNQGLSAARNTGIRNSAGELIALLDGDDYFHSDKLKAHVEYLEKNPQIEVTYNARFELNHSSTSIRELWRPPTTVDISDLIMGYPFAPSDMVIRREPLFRVGLFEVSYTYYGEDMDINCKLALDGCRFASVDRALNYRRYHSQRKINDLRLYQQDEFRPLYETFASDRFPEEFSDLKNLAFSNRYLGWAIFAFLQEDTELGQEYLSEAVKLNPTILEGRPSPLLEEIIRYSTLDGSRDHEELLQILFRQLPTDLGFDSQALDWAITRGYIIKGIRAMVWDRSEEGNAYLNQAISREAAMDKPLLTQTTFDLVNYENEFGWEPTRHIINNLSPYMQKIKKPENIEWSVGFYFLNRAYKSFDEHQFTETAPFIIKAIRYHPSYLLNKGAVKLFATSLAKTFQKNFSKNKSLL
jgi:glycosyltransferase involved in cell wall biosynthesis